jgi:hypothetical protein
MADPTQLSEVAGPYIDNGTVCFHILNKDGTKEIFFVNYILPGPGVSPQNHRNRNLHCVYHPRKIAEKSRIC